MRSAPTSIHAPTVQVYIGTEKEYEAREDEAAILHREEFGSKEWDGWRRLVERRVPISGKKNLILADLVLQRGRQLVDVFGRKAHQLRVKDGDAVGSDRVPPHLDQ